MNIKKTSAYAYFAILIYTSSITSPNDDFNFDFDISDQNASTRSISDDFDSFIDITPEELSRTRSCKPNQANIWLSIIKDLSVAPALDEPLYKKTSVPSNRNIITHPNFQICTYPKLEQQQFSTHLFFNRSSRKEFTGSTDSDDGKRIASYLNIENKNLLKTIDTIFESPLIPSSLRNNFKNLDSALLMRTFGNAHYQENKIGIFGHFYREINDTTIFEAKMPFMWMLRNLNFTPEEKDTIRKQISLFQSSGSAQFSFDEDAFARNHLIFDALGTGTLELNILKQIFASDSWTISLGAGMGLPTDYAFKRGLYGTYIDPTNKASTLEFCQLATVGVNTSVNPDALDIIQNYFYSVTDKLSSILLQCPLGNDRHTSLSLKCLTTWDIHDSLVFKGTYSLEALLPYEHARFFIPKETQKFSETFNNMPQDTAEQQQAKLDFFQNRLTTLFFPTTLQAKVFPGLVFTSTSCLQKNFNRCDFTVGYNGWYKSAERILEVYNKRSDLNLDFARAENDTAYVFKLFAKINKTIHSKRHNDFALSFWADSSVFTHNFGNDFTVGLSLDSKF